MVLSTFSLEIPLLLDETSDWFDPNRVRSCSWRSTGIPDTGEDGFLELISLLNSKLWTTGRGGSTLAPSLTKISSISPTIVSSWATWSLFAVLKMSTSLRWRKRSSFSQTFLCNQSGWTTLGTGLETWDKLGFGLSKSRKCSTRMMVQTFCIAAGMVIIFWIAELSRSV